MTIETSNRSVSLHHLLESIHSEALILPEIQRDFVWKKPNVLLLFDSLYEGLPIGQMLIWKSGKMVARKKTKTFKVGKSIKSFEGYLLDGQQRLSSLSLVKDGAKEFPLLFSLKRDNGKSRFSYKKPKGNIWFFPVSAVLNRDAGYGYMDVLEMVKAADLESGEAQCICSDFARLERILDYQVNVAEFRTNNHADATKLFIRFNSTGKSLNKNDLVLAQLALNIPKFVSGEMSAALEKYENQGFIFTRQFLVQCLVAIHKSRTKINDPNELISSPKEKKLLIKSWERASKGINKTIEFLSGEIRWTSSALIPSFGALIPLIFLISKGRKLSSKQRKLARKWLILSCVHGYFSGSSMSDIDHLLKYLKNEPTIEKLWRLSKSDLPRLTEKNFDTNRKSGAIMSLYKSYLINSGAKDWFKKTPLDNSVRGHSSGLQVHHIFPQALLKRGGIGNEKINNFGNYSVISQETNLAITDKEPIEYFKNLDSRQIMAQCIPSEKKLWQVDNFDSFLKQRRICLAEKLNKYLG